MTDSNTLKAGTMQGEGHGSLLLYFLACPVDKILSVLAADTILALPTIPIEPGSSREKVEIVARIG